MHIFNIQHGNSSSFIKSKFDKKAYSQRDEERAWHYPALINRLLLGIDVIKKHGEIEPGQIAELNHVRFKNGTSGRLELFPDSEIFPIASI